MDRKNLLLVEDDPVAKKRAQMLLGDFFNVQTMEVGDAETQTGNNFQEDLLTLVQTEINKMRMGGRSPDVLVTNLMLWTGIPEFGLSFIHSLKKAQPELPIVVWTKVSDQKIKEQVLRLRVKGLIVKDSDEERSMGVRITMWLR